MKFLILCLFPVLLPVLGHSQTKSLKYQWRKISGPLQYKIVTPDSSVTSVTDLVVGIYRFELKVTNSQDLCKRYNGFNS